MEERKDSQGRQSSLRPGGNLKSTLSGRSTPRGSPSFRRLNSSRTPRRDGRGSGGNLQWIRSNSLLLWLILITLWAYLGFYVQSKWAHGDNNKEAFVGYRSTSTNITELEQNQKSDVVATEDFLVLNNASSEGKSTKGSNLKKIDVSLAKKGTRPPSRRKTRRLTTDRRQRGKTRGKEKVGKEKVVTDGQNDSLEEQEEDIPKRNTSYGLIVGPFGSTEERILEWSVKKRSSTCDRKGEFARLVWSRKFVLIFHELSMTGAPLSMMELATELMSCGATVTAVVLSKKGGLMPEITRRQIKVLEDKAELSYKTAKKADLIIAGSAVCASWIEKYMEQFSTGSSQVAWWIMENRREYFDRSKLMLSEARMLIFLSETQSKQWLTWCEEEGIKLKSPPALIPLSVNDELAFVAGIPCSLNTPSFSVEKMLERRKILRDAVRKEMGLSDNDMLVMSLSSINPGKGQLLLLEAARLMADRGLSIEDFRSTVKEDNDSGIRVGQDHSTLTGKKFLRALFQDAKQITESANEFYRSDESTIISNEPKRKISGIPNILSTNNHTNGMTIGGTNNMRKVLSDNEGTQERTLRVLVGSVGSKSNKVPYVKGLLKFVSQHSELSKVVLWTPATTHVASLYSAADVYVINSQGLGETFGRVTIEAMAFGIPVLGTDAGGTRELVEQNVTGLLHPLGRPGTEILAQNLMFFMKNPIEREKMGMRGRKKVEKIYLKSHMYKNFAGVLFKCMRIK